MSFRRILNVYTVFFLLKTCKGNGRTVFWLGLCLHSFPEAANGPNSLTVNKIGQAVCSLRGKKKRSVNLLLLLVKLITPSAVAVRA